jgi:hypothetical protein
MWKLCIVSTGRNTTENINSHAQDKIARKSKVFELENIGYL